MSTSRTTRVAKAKAAQVAVYDADGRLVGLADPGKITPLASMPDGGGGHPSLTKPHQQQLSPVAGDTLAATAPAAAGVPVAKARARSNGAAIVQNAVDRVNAAARRGDSPAAIALTQLHEATAAAAALKRHRAPRRP